MGAGINLALDMITKPARSATERMKTSDVFILCLVGRSAADHWYLAVQVELPEDASHCPRSGNGVIGLDFGITTAVTLSTGEKIVGPKPLKVALRRLRIRARRHARKLKAVSCKAVPPASPTDGVEDRRTANIIKAGRALARMHARIANIRENWTHQLTTRLCRENQALAIEDLHVSGMLANHKLARAISDMGWYRIRCQLTYKAQRYGTVLVIAQRWYPSSKLCSGCGNKNKALGLSVRAWTCPACGARHDRDINAAMNLERLATGALLAHAALPVASPAATSDTSLGIVSAEGGKVTPVRNEFGQQDGSGQEGNIVQAGICSR